MRSENTAQQNRKRKYEGYNTRMIMRDHRTLDYPFYTGEKVKLIVATATMKWVTDFISHTVGGR